MLDAANSDTRGKVVIIGPGKIGCGYLAPLFAQAGWQVVIAARSAASAERIRAARDFAVHATGSAGARRVRADAVEIGSEECDAAIAGADLVATAVGTASIGDLGAPLARALATRPADRPLDVWAVENADVAPVLADAVRAAAAREALELPRVGFAGAIAWAAVAHGDWKDSCRPQFVGDDCRWLVVDETKLTRPLPALPGVEATKRYDDCLQVKRLIFGAGHALCAYLGARRGHRFIHEVIADPGLRPVIARSLAATRAALAHECEGPAEDVLVPAEWVLGRYANAELSDPIRRVARDPMRKLAADGPLVGAARLIQRATGTVPAAFAAGIASALVYRDVHDSQACRLTELLRGCDDVAAVLYDVSGLEPADPLAREVVRFYRRFKRSSRPQRPHLPAPQAA
jgi:mannitol-1-phosphate 5-dehydrogenase